MVEFRDTPPPPPVHLRETPTLVEDLCIALRHVALDAWALHSKRPHLDHIDAVKELHAELIKRGFDVTDRLSTLTRETTWDMATLLTETLAFPDITPLARGLDGIRSLFRCPVCQLHERPDPMRDACTPCLKNALAAAHNPQATHGFFVYRTYTPSRRCDHADDDTVMVALSLNDYDEPEEARCLLCIQAELDFRRDKA